MAIVLRPRRWYWGLLAGWLGLTLLLLGWSATRRFEPVSPAGYPGDMWTLFVSVYDKPLATLELLGRRDPFEFLFFFYIWLPLLAAPFGLFTRIDRE